MIGNFTVLSAASTNQNLPRLTELRMPYTVTTPGVTTMRIAVATSATKLVSVGVLNADEGEFFSDAGATVSLGQIHQFTTTGQKTIYFKSFKAGTFLIRNADEVSAFGSFFGRDWSPTNTFLEDATFARVNGFDVGNFALCQKLVSLAMHSHKFVGNLSVFAGITTLKNLGISATAIGNLTGGTLPFKDLTLEGLNIGGIDDFDVKNIPVTIKNIQTSTTLTGKMIHTGTNVQPAINTTLGSVFAIDALVKASVADTDKFIQALAASLPVMGTARTISIRGTRSAASDAAIATLTGKSVTIVLI